MNIVFDLGFFFNIFTPVLTGGAIHRLVSERYRGPNAMQHPVHTADGRRTVHGVVHGVHGAVLRPAHDVHHGTVRTDRTPS